MALKVYARGAPAVTENLVWASSRTGSPATGLHFEPSTPDWLWN